MNLSARFGSTEVRLNLVKINPILWVGGGLARVYHLPWLITVNPALVQYYIAVSLTENRLWLS